MQKELKFFIQNFLRFIPDSFYIKLMYYYHLKRFPNLKEPVTFSEKIQWLKLYDRKIEYTDLVDKIKVKDLVGRVIGFQHIIPTLKIWDSPADIRIDNLPNQFVLKCNHDSHSVILCNDKAKFDLDKAIQQLTIQYNNNAFWYGREWPYKTIQPRVFAEQFISESSGDLTDYKFYCFNGEPKYCQVITDRNHDERIDFFDLNWNHQVFTGLFTNKTIVANASEPIKKPLKLQEMAESAALLAKGKRFVRIDFYEVEGNYYFGEITFYPASGFGQFYPDSYNYILGDMLNLQ